MVETSRVQRERVTPQSTLGWGDLEGVMRQMSFLRGEHVNMHLYAIVRPDWKSEADYRQGFDFLESQ